MNDWFCFINAMQILVKSVNGLFNSNKER
jgi:hypothetical protein